MENLRKNLVIVFAMAGMLFLYCYGYVCGIIGKKFENKILVCVLRGMFTVVYPVWYIYVLIRGTVGVNRIAKKFGMSAIEFGEYLSKKLIDEDPDNISAMEYVYNHPFKTGQLSVEVLKARR